MKKWIIMLLIAAPLVYAYQKRPTMVMHQQALYFAATGEAASEETLAMEQWQKLRYRDFFIVTTMSDLLQLNLVSYGFINNVTIVDKEWTAKTFNLIPPKDQ